MADGCMQQTVTGMDGPITVRFLAGVPVRVVVRLPGSPPARPA